MSSETEDSMNAAEDSHNTEMNGDVPSPAENGNNKENVTEDVIVEEKSGENNTSKNGSTADKLQKEVGPSDDSSRDVSNSHSKDKVEADDSVLVEDDDVIEEVTNERNGEDKDHLDDESGGKEGKKGTGQRRMSLRPRAAPKKYVDVEESSDDDVKDPLATKDPLAIPLGKNSSTVLIRKSLSPTTASVSVKPSGKPPLKIGKVTRPPPELIKAPSLHKLSVSPSTTVTVVPRSKENANPGFVIVDTQSILTGKGPVAVSTVPASVTVSAVPPVQVTPKQPSKTTSLTASASTTVMTTVKKTTSSNATAHSLPDPFEALGLADDSFIVEAPSFVVPYLIEKTAPQNFRKHIDTMIPKQKDKKAEDVIVLSEDDSNESTATPTKNEKKDPDSTDKSAVEKSSMKAEMEKSQNQGQTKTAATKEQDNYFAGPIGRFFLDIGLSLVQEYVQGDLLRVQKRKASKGSKISDPSLSVSALSKGLDITRAKNDPYRLPLRQCDRCNFKSESRLVMAHHWNTPFPIGYGSSARFGCHWCPFETKESHLVSAHIEAEHDLKSRATVDRLMHQCPLCPFEDNIKSKVTRHVLSCQKRYVPERNQEPPLDWEPPAKIPRIPPRNVRNFHASSTGAAGLAAAIGAAGGISASSLASYQMAASAKGNATFALPSFHPLLPKSALLNSLGYSVLPTAGQLAYLSNLTSTLQGKSGKGAAAAAAAVAAQTLAGLRLPAELHVVQGSAQQRSSTPPQSAQSKTASGGASYRQSSQSGQSSTSTLFLSSGFSVPNNQIYQQLLHSQGATMSVLPASASKSLAVGGVKKNVTGSTSSSSSVTLVPGLVSTSSGLTIQSSSTPSPAANKTRSNQQPSISITPLPRTTSASTTATAASPAASNKPSLSVSPVTPTAASAGNTATPLAAKPGQPTTAGQKGSAICEICDGYIKDLEQLRHHMQWIHKVKIHPKMIHNRPPLNCQKCQCRFFTDQGLERHLLGSHGLVTSSMQEAANRGQDGGRCPICGKVHQWKLLSHVVKDHGLSLKPAHLSYKCTVCTATFTMYKLFENHVYTAHSVVARKVLDKDKEKDKDKKPASGSTNNSTSGLRINDEITIIPQPARQDNSSSSGDQQNVCRSCHSTYDPGEVKRQLKRLDISASHIPGSDQKCASCLRLSSITKGEKRSRVDVIDLSDDEDHHHHQDGGVMLPKSQVTITKVPAPKGYNSRNNKESSSSATVVVKRSRMDDHDSD